MTTTVHLFSEFDALRITADDTEPTVWIGARRSGVTVASVSMTLDLAGIEALETALAALRMNLSAQAARKAA